MNVANFFKRKDKLDYTRIVFCPTAGKIYFPEKGKNICPVCGQEFENSVDGRDLNAHYVYSREEGYV